MVGEYDDILNHPHHVSKRHARMSMMDRAAQFAPFSALTGYGEAIQDATRKRANAQEWTDEGE